MSRKRVFSNIKVKVWQQLQSWNDKLLFQGGKKRLLKVVALTISIFTMSYFKLPTFLCTELESLIANFWYRQNDGNSKIHWVGWKNICKLKYRGGLDFKELNTFNLAFLQNKGGASCKMNHCYYTAFTKQCNFSTQPSLKPTWRKIYCTPRGEYGKLRLGCIRAVYSG